MTLVFLIQISQSNIESDDIGFRNEQTIKVKIINDSGNSDGNGNGSGSDHNNDNNQDNNLLEKEWPSDMDFNDKKYYLKEKLYYSSVSGKLTTISPGILYLKVEKDLTQEEINEQLNYLKSNNFLSVEQNKKLKILEVKYVVNKGFVLAIGVNQECIATTHWLEFHSTWSSAFGYIGITEFGLPLLLSSDVLTIKSETDEESLIYTSQSGTNLVMETPKENNNLWGEMVILPLKEKIVNNFEIFFEGDNPEYFAFEFVSDTQFRIIQKGDAAGKRAVLNFTDKNRKIVYQKKVESVAHYVKSDIGGLTNDFDMVTESLFITKENDYYKGTASIYMQLPSDYLSNYIVKDFSTQEGYTVESVAYSKDSRQMRINVSYFNEMSPLYKQIGFLILPINLWRSIEYNVDNIMIQKRNLIEESFEQSRGLKANDTFSSPKLTVETTDQSFSDSEIIESVTSESTELNIN